MGLLGADGRVADPLRDAALGIAGQDQRFLGMRFNVATGPLTAGNFTAGFQLDFQDARIFPASTST